MEVFSRPGGDQQGNGDGDGVSHGEIIDGPWVITIEDFVTDEERLYRMQILQ